MSIRSQLVCMLFILASSTGVNAQGKYSGAFKKLIGTTFKDERHMTSLPGYKFRQGSMAGDINGPHPMGLYVFIKGSSAVVALTQVADSAANIPTIVDVIDIRNIPKGWEIKTGGCQVGEAEGQTIVGLVNPGKKEYTSVIRQAWFCNLDKLRFEAISTKNMKCLNEGQD
jgi:hypothetical protein